MMRKVSLTGGGVSPKPITQFTASTEVLELFFNTGITLHEVALPGGVPDIVVGFLRVEGSAAVRRAQPGEEPDIELSPSDHLPEMGARWFPIPFQVSAPFAIQGYLAAKEGGSYRLLLAIDTLAYTGAAGRALDAAIDEGRPFRALELRELGAFFDHPEIRQWIARTERGGLERALLKYAALLEALAPVLPKVLFRSAVPAESVPVSLVVDFGNSRSSALLLEARPEGVLAIPLELRHLGDPFVLSEETFDSRVTFLPSPFDRQVANVATAENFVWPSIARLGREAWDRALETPHRYQCSVSSPKRYLWDADAPLEPWFFAEREGGEYRGVAGRILKYIQEDAGGLALREDGPSTPPNPRYAPRTMMLFAFAEILSQAYAQINAPRYRKFQGRESAPRRLANLVLTYPSGMHEAERQVYDALVRNAVILSCHLLGIPEDLRPNWNAQTRMFEPFLFTDEALASQMVFVYQEVADTFKGSMEDFAVAYGRGADERRTVRIASIDIGGGTSDVMIADYEDKVPGTGTALAIQKRFQDGVSIAGDEVCRTLVEEILIAAVFTQLNDTSSRQRFGELFLEGDAGLGAHWRTLRAKLVVAYWLPLARCLWALGEGSTPAGLANDASYTLNEALALFGAPAAHGQILEEADRVISSFVPAFPGLRNLRFAFRRSDVDAAVARCLREPLRRYADIIAQYDVDVLVLAGRTSKLLKVRELLVDEMPVTPPRLKIMSRFRVGDWYPSKWREGGLIKDPKSTVAAGAAILHLANQNRLAGFSLASVDAEPQAPIFGLFQETEPHISHENELFADGGVSPPFLVTSQMRIGFRNVASEEMDGSPLFEVKPATERAQRALGHDRIHMQFTRMKDGQVAIQKVKTEPGAQVLEPNDFTLALRTSSQTRYWLDTGVFGVRRFLSEEAEP